MESIVLKIAGMSCQGCVNSVTKVLGEIPGVRQVAVSLASGEASFTYEPGKAGPADFRAAVDDAGYEVK